MDPCFLPYGLQNRRDFLRISGVQRRKRGEREAQVACSGRSNFLAILPSHATRVSRSPRALLAFASVPQKYAKKLLLFCRLLPSDLFLRALRPWGLFLESPGNLTGPKSYFEIKVSRKLRCVLISNEVNFVSLADNFTV